MAIGRDQAHSALEIVPHQSMYQMNRENKPLPTDLGKQVVPEDGKQSRVNNGEIEVTTHGDLYTHYVGDHHLREHRFSRRKWVLSVGAVALVVILTAVLGGVLGTRHTRSAAASPTSLSNSSATSPSTMPPQRNIAAFSFTLDSVNNTRIYFQDNVGQIMEAANSSKNNTWSISRTGVGGKNGSAIAAAVSRPDLPPVISVFYLDVDNLIYDIGYSPSTGKWNMGALSDQGYTAMPNSSLTAMYNQCRMCANTTIIAFQDKNGFVQIGNLTSGGWTLTQLGPALDPEIGTGLALQPFYINGFADQINLYYQKSNLNMSLASWKPASTNNGIDGWSLSEQNYDTIPSGSPIATASSYSNVSTGYETWIEVLFLSNKGIEVNTWSGALNDWQEQYMHPSVMANSTTNKKVFEDVAVTSIGNAFGVVKQDGQADTIENWLVEDDMVDWSFVGNVDLGGAWG